MQKKQQQKQHQKQLLQKNKHIKRDFQKLSSEAAFVFCMNYNLLLYSGTNELHK